MKWRTISIIAVVAVFLLNPNPTQPSQPKDMTMASWQPIIIRAYMSAYATQYDTEPAYLMAVAHIESRKSNQEFRVGLMGRKYYGPCGIHRCFLARWPIDRLEGNIETGARALAGIHDLATLKRRLRRYNCEFNGAYWSEVCKAIGKYSKGVSL